VLNWKNGVETRSVSSSGAQELVMSATLAPIGMLSAIAIPSFVKARSTSQQNACINNLRQIDSAKEQWAMANRKMDGEEADIDGISEYIKGNRLPTCPGGGTYTVGAIGEMPTCSKPGHALR